MSRTLLFEIGTEEIPSAPLYGALRQLEAKVPAALDEARLAFDEVHVAGTARRLVVTVRGLADERPDLERTIKGPPAKAAFDDDGQPTKAALGFAKKHGIDVGELERREEGGQEYVFAVVREQGGVAADVLPEVLAGVAASLAWPKSMRWGSRPTTFVRPVRWLVCLLGAEVVPVEFAGLTADRVSRGHRFLAGDRVEIPAAGEYGKVMERAKVAVDVRGRADLVRGGVQAAAEKVGARAVMPEKVFDEVVNLVEWPSPAAGGFDEEFLSVPRKVLESAMESHQRYFPVEGPGGELTPHFIVVHDGAPEETEGIVAGHERVIRARLADAAFFYREDLKKPLEAYVADLESIVFQEKLGTMADRTGRVVALAKALARQAGVAPDVAAWALRAAHLAKADLVTQVVVEFPELQGVMGREYALAGGEAPEVAEAILEHYRPRFAGDEPPASQAGTLVSVADRLDTMAGLFAVGMPPTGSADPYALRRGALGILSMLVGSGVGLTLDDAIAAALHGYADTLPGLDVEAVGAEMKSFILGRMETLLKSRGHAYDTVDAVLAVSADDPADAVARADALSAVRRDEALDDVWVAFSRAKNLCATELGTETDRTRMTAEEAALADALDAAEEKTAAALEAEDYPGALAALAGLRAPIDTFFDDVLVMHEDEALRTNRLRLLNRLVALFMRFADLSRLAE